MRGELGAYRRQHRASLAELVDGADIRWREDPEGKEWAAVVTTADGVEISLGVDAVLRKTTFIEYLTRLTLVPPAGSAFAPPPHQLPGELVERMERLTAKLEQTPRRLEITVRPSEPVLEHYSYAVRAQLDPEILRELMEVGVELSRRLRTDAR